MKTYRFTGVELNTWFTEYPPKLEDLVEKISEIKGIDFKRCKNIRVEKKILKSPQVVFDYEE